MSGINSSINSLIGTFANVSRGANEAISAQLVCIDTSNNRIGINTIDPSYAIHVTGDSVDDNSTVAAKKFLLLDNGITDIGELLLSLKGMVDDLSSVVHLAHPQT